MQSWLLAKILRRNLRLLRDEGKVGPTLLLDARDVELTFPGQNSWAGTFRGKRQVKAWLERFAISGLQIFADEVVLKGTPLRGTVCIRGTDHLDDADGNRVYENRYVIWGHLRWGKLKRYEVYEDTEKSAALDRWMEEVGHPAAASMMARRRRGKVRQTA